MPRRHDQRDLSAAAQQYLLALRVMAGSTSRPGDRGPGRAPPRRHHPGRQRDVPAAASPTGSSPTPRAATCTSPPPGRAAADGIFRRHALLEWLLTSVIGLGWAESDDEAMRLQGAISPRVEARLDEMLGHPETCPHGNPIDAETARRRPAGTPLSEMEAGDRRDDLPDHRGGRGGRRPAVVPRGPGPDPGRPRHDPGPRPSRSIR